MKTEKNLREYSAGWNLPALVLKALHVIARQFFLTRHCFFVYEYNCVKFYKKLPWTLGNNRLSGRFLTPLNFLDSFFTRTSQRTSFRVPEFDIKYFKNDRDFYCFLRLDGSARVSEIKWWMFRIISLWTERVIASYILKNIDFWSMQKRSFLIFISKTICRIKKF